MRLRCFQLGRDAGTHSSQARTHLMMAAVTTMTSVTDTVSSMAAEVPSAVDAREVVH